MDVASVYGSSLSVCGDSTKIRSFKRFDRQITFNRVQSGKANKTIDSIISLIGKSLHRQTGLIQIMSIMIVLFIGHPRTSLSLSSSLSLSLLVGSTGDWRVQPAFVCRSLNNLLKILLPSSPVRVLTLEHVWSVESTSFQ
jgi:hypothetical protein